MDRFEELAKLGELMKSWILTEEEFASEKAKVLASDSEVGPNERFSDRFDGKAPDYALALAVFLLALLAAIVALGLVKSPAGTVSMVNGLSSSGTSGGGQAATDSQYPGCDTPDIYLTGSNQYWAACNVGASNAFTGKNVAATCGGGCASDPYPSNRNVLGSYFQWGRNFEVTTLPPAPGWTGADADAPYFYTGSDTTSKDWIFPQNGNLWGGRSTPSAGTFASLGSPAAMRGPCATWYHVPTQQEWCDAIIAVSPTQDVGTSMPCDANWHLEATADKFMTTLKLPLAGTRHYSSAAFGYQGTYGYYWAASTAGTYGNLVLLSSTLGVFPADHTSRAFGFSVRCLRD